MTVLRLADRTFGSALPVAAGLVAVAVGLLVPVVGVVPVAAAVALVVVLGLTVLDPGVPLYAAAVLGLTALPTALSGAVAVGPVQLFVFEPFFYLGAALALVRAGRRRLPVPLGVLAVVAAAGAVGGLVAGNAVSPWVGEVRPMIGFLVAVATAVAVAGTVQARRLAVVAAVVLWASSVTTLLGSLEVLDLGGREESAVTGNVATADDAVRLLTPAVTLAYVALLASVVLVVTGRVALTRTLPWVVPAVPIVVLAFTRGHVIGLVAALAVALLTVRRWSVVGPALRGSTLGAGGLVGVGLLVSVSPAGAWFSRQLTGFSTRVLGGLSGARDASVLWREQETSAVLPKIAESPVVGHGFGAAYKLPSGARGTFFGDQAPYYVHDYYLWLALKVGVVGVAAYLVLALVPLVRIVARRADTGDAALVSAAVSAAWLVIEVTSPAPLGLTGALVAGAVVGSTWALAGGRRASPAPVLVGRPA